MSVRVDQAVLEVLARSTVAETFVQLPDETLERGLYMKVAKALEACGFKWHRQSKKHVGNGAEVVEQLLLTGEYTDAKKEFDAFYTPGMLAARVAEALALNNNMTVLEPSFGEGALMKAVFNTLSQIDGIAGVEKNPALCAAMREKAGLWKVREIIEADFLTVQPTMLAGYPFDRAVMNPPFSKGQDAKHILHALKFLKPGGRLVAIAGAGVKFRTDGAYQALKIAMTCSPVKRYSVQDLPEGSFKASGTNVNTVLVTIDV